MKRKKVLNKRDIVDNKMAKKVGSPLPNKPIKIYGTFNFNREEVKK